MKKILFSLIAITGLCMTTGCNGPVDSQDEADEVDDTEVGEAQQALINTTVQCSLIFGGLGQLSVKLKNNTGFEVGPGALHYTIHHDYPITVFGGGASNFYLAAGATKSIDASSDPNAISASYCTAYVRWDP